MIRIIIVDDNAEQRAYIAQSVRTLMKEDANVACYSSAENYYLQPNLPIPDIAILDIQLPGDSGIQLASLLNQYAPFCQILYLSNFIDYAVDVYKTTHTWFITKDRIDQMLPLALQQALTNLKNTQSSSLCVALKNGERMIPQANILYLERDKRLTHIVLPEEKIECSTALTDLWNQLDQTIFARCHNSYLVNLHYISYFRRTELELSNGEIIPVSRRYHADLQNQFGDFISRSISPDLISYVHE